MCELTKDDLTIGLMVIVVPAVQRGPGAAARRGLHGGRHIRPRISAPKPNPDFHTSKYCKQDFLVGEGVRASFPRILRGNEKAKHFLCPSGNIL